MKALVMMVLSVVMLRTCNRPSMNYPAPTPVSFQQFYDELSPYGNWVETPDYGYAWVPDVDEGFRPYYTNGNWVATDVGNTWVSDYPWGWAPFHYGNWAYTDPYGWAWKPGYDWAPAHVSWRQGNGFYGWAPLLAGLAIGAALNRYRQPDDWWVFVPQNRLYDNNVYRYWRGPQYNAGILPNTTYITNVYKSKTGNSYFSGPRPNEWVKQTGKKLDVRRVVDVASATKAGRKKDGLHVYRPAVKQEKGARPSPDKVMQSWSGKGRGNKPANVKTDERGNRQQYKAPPAAKQNQRGSKQLDKAPPAAKQNQRGPDARGKQHVSPERKPSSPAKHTPRSAPVRKEHRATAPKRTQHSAPARKETRARAPQQRSSSKPAHERVRSSRPPAPRKQSQPARQQQQRTQQRSQPRQQHQAQPRQQHQAQPRQQHQAQPAGGRGGQQKPHGGGGGKKK